MRYKIYDGKSEVITPSGKVYTAEQWLEKYPWAKVHKMIISGGVINGSLAIIYDDYKESLEKAGADFSTCKTDEDVLKAMEAFEDAAKSTSTTTITTQERIANALEDLVVLNMPDVE